jgi:hypothetical protein
LWTYQEAALTHQHHYQLASTAMTLADIKAHFSSSSKEIGDISTLLYFNATALINPVSVFAIIAPTETALRFRYMANALIFRATSHARDEAICLAGVLGRDVSDLVTLQDGEERVAQLLGSLDTVPDSILFIDRPRRRRKGEGWMPVSFLNGGMTGLMPANPGVGVPTKDGLIVECQGLVMVVEEGEVEEGRQGDIGEKEGGINALIVTTDRHSYHVTATSAQTNLPSLITHLNTHVGILLKDPIQFHNRYWGVVVEVLEDSYNEKEDEDGVLYCRYESFVHVTRDDMSEWPVGFTFGERKANAVLRKTGRWCVG